MMRKLIAILSLSAALAAGAEKQLPPSPGTPKPFVLPPHESYTLANGMLVTLVPWGTLPVATVRLNMAWGRLNETKDQVWLAEFTAALMKEGAAGMTGAQLASAAARLGGELNFDAGPESSLASLSGLGEFAPEGVKLVGQLIRHPDFPSAEVERLRANLLRRVVVAKSDPESLADEAFTKATYGDHPYGRVYPSEEQLKSYTLDDIHKFYTANFGARRAHLYVAGQFDSAAVKKAIGEAFDDWPAGPERLSLPPTLKTQHSFLLLDRPGAEQSNLRIGLPVVAANPATADYIPMKLTDAILGGLFNSRITANIREDKGYTYSPFSFIDTHPGSAVWTQGAAVTTNVTSESIHEIFKEIDGMRKEPPSEKELQGAKNALTGLFVLGNASPGGVISQLVFTEEYGLGDSWLDSYVQKLNAVTRADVQRLAESLLDPGKMTIVVVGDKSKIGAKLEQYQKQ